MLNETQQKKFKGSETRENQPDWPTAADHGANERGGKRGHCSAQDTQNTGKKISLGLEPVKRHSDCVTSPHYFRFCPGGHNSDHEDEEAHQQCTAADGAGGDPEEHVFTTEEDDQGADRVAHRPQVHKAG